jgi:tRNA-2-methylthio-N6-dimethylallyladenosine synthase
MKEKTFFIQTFGCQANKNDSERISGYFYDQGLTEVDSYHKADLILMNTCSIRKTAEDRVRGLVQNIMKEKLKAKVILTGCMMRLGEKRLKKMLPRVDEFWELGRIGFDQKPNRKDKNHIFVQISNGCNSFCTYCVVPYSRGREISRPIEEILQEIKDGVAIGATEVTLLGQNVNSYGLEKISVANRKNLFNKENLTLEDVPSNQSQYHRSEIISPFVGLIREVSKIESIKKIRFLTSNPWDFHEDLIQEIAKNPKIDNFLHIPIQSGSNAVLKRMNRGYTRENYLNLIERLKKARKDLVFGTDIIVGFCGETEEEFQESVSLAKKVGYVVGFVAMYSWREGTLATKIYQDSIAQKEKKRRWEILDKIINKDNLSRRPKVV